MYDFHLHSKISFDSECEPKDIVSAAEKSGLKEICFTDHYDFNDIFMDKHNLFDIDSYRKAYDDLSSENVKLLRGVEFGLTSWNQKELDKLLDLYNFDFVIGSVHCVGGYDPYNKEFWTYHEKGTGIEKFLLQTLDCVKLHKNFDVLGHLNYVCKYIHDPDCKPEHFYYYTDICDEIMKVLVQNGKGMEINTSGVDKSGDFLPPVKYIKRFHSLGGEIVTVGSDSHTADRVGQHIPDALELIKEIFGYVCTFENRKAHFHKL